MWKSLLFQIFAGMDGSLIDRGLSLGFPTSHLRYQQISQSKRRVPVQPLSILDLALHVVRPKQIIWILVMIRFLTIGGDFSHLPHQTPPVLPKQENGSCAAPITETTVAVCGSMPSDFGLHLVRRSGEITNPRLEPARIVA